MLVGLAGRASPPSPLSICDGEGEEVLANERLRLLAARYGAIVAHLRRIFLFFLLVGVFWRGSYALLSYSFFLWYLYLGMHRGCVVGYEQINNPM